MMHRKQKENRIVRSTQIRMMYPKLTLSTRKWVCVFVVNSTYAEWLRMCPCIIRTIRLRLMLVVLSQEIRTNFHHTHTHTHPIFLWETSFFHSSASVFFLPLSEDNKRTKENWILIFSMDKADHFGKGAQKVWKNTHPNSAWPWSKTIPSANKKLREIRINSRIPYQMDSSIANHCASRGHCSEYRLLLIPYFQI